jgi:hypothetical protein
LKNRKKRGLERKRGQNGSVENSRLIAKHSYRQHP